MQAPKNGFFYVLDRITGEFISAQPYANVSWAQGIDQKTGRPITNPEAWYGPEGMTLSPGPGGAHNWAPMSYNPATGLVYLPASNSSYLYAKQPDFVFKRGEGEFQGIGRSQTAVARGGIPGTPPKAQPPIVGPEAGREIRGGGYLLAWDPVTQKERWRALGGGAIGGGTVTTAGNLVLQVVPDGRFIAYSADKGEKLLEVSTGQRGMGPPVTYQLDGRQYAPSSPARARCRPTHLVAGTRARLALRAPLSPESRRVALPRRPRLRWRQAVVPLRARTFPRHRWTRLSTSRECIRSCWTERRRFRMEAPDPKRLRSLEALSLEVLIEPSRASGLREARELSS